MKITKKTKLNNLYIFVNLNISIKIQIIQDF